MKPELINTTSLLKIFLDGLKDIEGEPPSLFVDLEGNNLSRVGTLSLVTILVEPQRKVYLIDVTTLGKDAFVAEGSDGRNLRNILESSKIIKVLFDIRNDSDALYNLYDIHVRGIWDLQLMELASRNFPKRCVNGLAKCIEKDSRIEYGERAEWRKIKEKGRDLFDPSRGGSYAVFDQRPLSSEVEEYCTQDVALMPHLCDIYREKLCDAWWRKIQTETDARITLSQTATYNGQGRHMAEAPQGWMHWRPSAVERSQRTLFTVPTRHSKPMSSNDLPTDDDAVESAPHSPADLSKLLEGMKLKGSDSAHDSDSEHEFERGWVSYGRDYYGSDRDEVKDYTACDTECGYCGSCPY